ncbi:FkbM family methyltransferase [Undibacter mobilis]|uniref:FkbM family methyltransferase n=1 Tax=Undibacter mobilis TaxID=2292256 RepID=UPI00143CEE18|nr:FkbM family methyltransferase [Undibacter mobilis]
MVATSHERETQLVAAFFGGVEGYFVEVGANEPRLRSQTWHLEQAGWRGILVEPQPNLVEELRAMRTAKVFAVACSGPENLGRTLPFHVAGPLSSLDRAGMAPGARPEKVIEVPVRTLDSILEEAQAPVAFDFLSIDVEGHEIEVLRGFDLRRWQPRLVMIEDHVADLSKHDFMRAAGYRIIRRYENNGWYVPQESEARMALGDAWEIVRKYYLALPIRKLRNFSRYRRGTIGVAAAGETG